MAKNEVRGASVRARWPCRALALVGAGMAALAACAAAAQPPDKREPAPTPVGLLVVLNKEDSTVSFFQARAAGREGDRIRLLKTLPTGKSPHEVAISPDGREAWVSNADANTVGIYDLRRLEQTDTLRHEGFSFPHGSAFTPDGKRFYLACTSANAVFAIDVPARTVLARIPTNQKASHMVAMAPDGAEIYVPNIESRMVSFISTGTNSVVEEVRVGRGPEGIALSPDGSRLLVANQEDSTLSVIDARERRVIDALGVGDFPVRVIITPDGARGFTADRKGNTLTAIDLSEEYAKVIRRIPIGKSPGGMALDQDGRTLFVSLNDEARVVLFDVRLLTKVGELKTGKGPDGMAFVPGWKGAAGG